MNLATIVLMLVIFPFNSLLFMPESLSFSQDGYEKSSDEQNQLIQTEKAEGRVEGIEEKKDKIFSEISSLPIRKENSTDLILPNAHSSLILDVNSGTILHYNNGKERRPIASLTKLMTAVLVIERVKNLEEVVVVDEQAVYAEGTKIGCPRSGYCKSQRLKVGEKISVLNLLKAMLMSSANDAAIALAKHVSGSEEEFVKIMNEKAQKLGLSDTHFCTASGLEIEGAENSCYSSAYDISRVAAYAMKYDLIWEIMRLPDDTIIYSSDGTVSHSLFNTDLVLNQISNCLGGKTGFTPAAGHSLLLAASDQEGKNKIIAVVLDDPYRWQDIKKMVDWAFTSYEWQ